MGGGIGVQQVRSVQSPQKLSAGVEQCGALFDGKAEPNELEQSSKRGGRSAQLKPTVTCQKQKPYCRASSGRAEKCASTICTKLAPWCMVKFISRSRPEIISNADQS
jgi:hypothetical protein